MKLVIMNKALFIAYHYPPLGGAGVFRTLKFTKYLSNFNYQPLVLTVKNPMYNTKDPSLLEEIPPGTKICRVFSFEHKALKAPRLLNFNLKWFYIPDEHVGWIPFAVSYGSKLVWSEDIDVIFATAPINTTLLIGSLLKKKTKKPLVVDYRDPWITNSFIKYPTQFHEFIETKMEKFVLTQADYITVVNDLIRDDLIKRYPFVESKIETLTNGFDSEDFENLNFQKKNSKFRIIYTGSIYGLRTARTFLDALKELIMKNEEFKKDIEVIFVGNQGKETPYLVKNLHLEKYVTLMGYLPHKKCLEIIKNSDVQLLLVTSEENLPSKIFEYLASQKPIMAIAPENSVASELIKSLDAGVLIPPRNLGLIKKAILCFYQKWRTGKLFTYTNKSKELQKYNRINLTQRLSRIFDKVKK